MRWAVATVLVVAIVVVAFYVARGRAEAMPIAAQPATPTTPVNSISPMYTAPLLVPPVTLERSAEEIWRARVMLAAQDYERAAQTYVDRFPTYREGRVMLAAAHALAAAASTASKAEMVFRIAFASRPPAGAAAALRARESLDVAVRAPIVYRPADPIVVVPGIIPIGDFSV